MLFRSPDKADNELEDVVGQDDDEEIDHIISDMLEDLEETILFISKGYEDIRSSSSEILADEKKIDDMIINLIRNNSYKSFENLMEPFINVRSTDIQIEALLISIQLIRYVPRLTTSIKNWAAKNINIYKQYLQKNNNKDINKNKNQLRQLRLLPKKVRGSPDTKSILVRPSRPPSAWKT